MENKDLDKMPKKSPFSFQVDLSKFEKATDEEKRQQEVMSESSTFFKDGMRKLMKNPFQLMRSVIIKRRHQAILRLLIAAEVRKALSWGVRRGSKPLLQSHKKHQFLFCSC